MTEQEAQLWAKRLTRIWKPEKVERYVRQGASAGAFNYTGYICDDVRLEVDDDGTEQEELFFELHVGHVLSSVRFLTASTSDGVGEGLLYGAEVSLQLPRQRLEEWLPFFRGGCWLCGCDIEATAHEKAEWIQGFSCEELVAWNLGL